MWVVEPAPPAQPNADQVRATLHQSTAGDLGRTAGSVGQTAGSFGRSAGDLGHPASLEGQPAGSVGQSAGSFGQTAGSLGQAAGSYGVSAGDLGMAPASASPTTPEFLAVKLASPWEHMASQLHADFSALKAEVVPVSAADLLPRLIAAERAHALPDVLLSDPGVLGLRSLGPVRETMADGPALDAALRQGTMAPLGNALAFPQGSSGYTPPAPPEAVPLARAPDPAEAGAFLVWLRDGMRAHWESDWAERGRSGGKGPEHAEEAATAAGVAAATVEALLEGAGVSAADPAMAVLQPAAAQRSALHPTVPAALEGLAVQVDVLRAAANQRFAVVMLRAIAASSTAFGVVHSLVVLRRDTANANTPGGPWRVLQITPDLPPELLVEAFRVLSPSTYGAASHYGAASQRVSEPAGVTLASPVDGDVRSAVPELWWDNGGGDDLLLVEWQGNGEGGSHLFLVPDHGNRLQTRVSALFAWSGTYRWRVWALGPGDTIKLTGWRQFSVVR